MQLPLSSSNAHMEKWKNGIMNSSYTSFTLQEVNRLKLSIRLKSHMPEEFETAGRK